MGGGCYLYSGWEASGSSFAEVDREHVSSLLVAVVHFPMVEIADALHDSQPESVALRAVTTVIEATEDVLLVEGTMSRFVAHTELTAFNIDIHVTSRPAMTDGIHHEIGEEAFNERLVARHYERCRHINTECRRPAHRLPLWQHLVDESPYLHAVVLGKLPIIELGEQEQTTADTRHAAQFHVDVLQILRLSVGETGILLLLA